MISQTKSVSILGSQQKDKKEQRLMSFDLPRWYHQMYQHRSQYRRAPASLQTYKDSHPYRLVLSKLQGLSLTKKSGSSELYLGVSALLFTEKFDLLGVPFHYQFEQPLPRSDRFEYPLALYFHSRIDKNYEGLYLTVRLKALQIRDNVVEQVQQIGTCVIRNPLIEEDSKQLPVFKQFDEVEFGYLSVQAKNKVLSGTSPSNLSYSIESMLELKKLVRLLPENMLFSHQNYVCGLQGGYLPRQPEQQLHISEAAALQVTLSFLQVHVSEKYEAEVQSYLRKVYPLQKNFDIKNRKVVVGYHNGLTLVSPASRKLEQIDKEIAGQTRISILEALKEGQIIKLNHYGEKGGLSGAVAVGLIYEIGNKQLEVACYYLIPIPDGEDISQKMLLGPGFGLLHQLLPLTTNDKPTLIMQYSCQSREPIITAKQGQFVAFGDKKIAPSTEAVQKQRQKLREQIQRERLEILKEKEEMEKIKATHELSFQAQFERKFQQEKQNLYKRQQLLENQYREQLQREVREKFEMQQQIRRMAQKLKNLQQNGLRKFPGQASYAATPHDDSPPRYEVQGDSQPVLRQRIDPTYTIQPENPLPVKKARQILERGGKVGVDIVKASEDSFGWASIFSFSFSAVSWSKDCEPPSSIYLVIRFFNCPVITSDPLKYLQAGQSGLCRLVRWQSYLQGRENSEPVYTFMIDPSDYPQPAQLQRDLTNYLAHHNAIVDVFSGQTHLYIGQLNLRLQQLLRGNRAQSLCAKEVRLLRLSDREQIGVVQLLIRNEQAVCKNEVSIKHQARVKDLKKKIISNSPLFITPENTQAPPTGSQPIKKKANNATRQELRIQKFKQQKANSNFAHSANSFSDLLEGQRGVVLNQIQSYKEKKMQDYLKGVYEGLLSEKITISALFAQATVFPFTFTNTSHSPSAFRISILLPGQQSKELTVVKANREWRALVAAKNFPEPKRYDMVGENDTFFLQPGESIPLLFKYLSFKDGRGGQRLANVTISKEDNNWIAGGFTLLIQIHEQIIHHSYVLYEPAEQTVDLIVPVIYADTMSAAPKRLHLTDSHPNSSAQWLNPYEVLMRTTTPVIMEKTHFNLLLYDDEYFCQLRENWLIQIHAYQGVCANYRQDAHSRFKITLPWSAVPAHLGLLSLEKAQSTLKLYSSWPGLIFKNNTIELDDDRSEQGGCEIWCQLIGGDNLRKSLQITCVSGQQNELLYGWVVTIYPYLSRS